MQTTNIGLNTHQAAAVAKQLNKLLSNYQIYYMNLRGFHWNIKGKNFFELHLKFEELYDDALLKIDEIAERILTLSNTPLHTFEQYLSLAKVEVAQQVTSGEAAITNILDALKILIASERDILNLASQANDEGTVSLMSDYIVAQEKLVWMLSAYQHDAL